MKRSDTYEKYKKHGDFAKVDLLRDCENWEVKFVPAHKYVVSF